MPRNADSPLPQPVFDEGNITPDPTRFAKPHSSDNQQYKQIENLLKKDVVSFDPSRGLPGDLYTLQSAYGVHGPEIIQRMKTAKKIIFHAAGDTGASSAGSYPNEISVADQMTSDCRIADQANRPAFFYHLGDIVYNFGESIYYYDQFYEPYRDYPAPIFAIPGNHDSFILPNTPADQTPLSVFARNFCAEQPTITPETGSLHRTAMTQPGVYFTLDAPFVRIIGLFSNALEDPGVISSDSKKWPSVPDIQLDYLTAQLARIKKENYAGAVVIAAHHPPFCYAPPAAAGGKGGDHGSSSRMLAQIDAICAKQGVYPHAFLSGHSHNYQRFARTVRFGGKDFEVPFVVCGDGGHNVNRMIQARRGVSPQEPNFGASVNYMDPPAKAAVKTQGLVLKHYDDTNYGYLRITVDATSLGIGFHQVGKNIPQSRVDMVTVDLASHTIVSN